jgi:hypothetical protein
LVFAVAALPVGEGATPLVLVIGGGECCPVEVSAALDGEPVSLKSWLCEQPDAPRTIRAASAARRTRLVFFVCMTLPYKNRPVRGVQTPDYGS